MFVRVVDTPAGSGGPRAGREERSFEIQPRDARRHRLRLWGDLPRGWAAPLFRGLARHGIQVVRGHARREADGRHHASFEIERGPRASDPLRLDVLALATARPAASAAAAAFVLDGHRLLSSRAFGGSLRLDVHGPDQHGFLGGLLDRLTFLSLVPEAMAVETGPEGVCDRFHLKTVDGRMPGPAVRGVLRDVLDGRLLTGEAPAARAG
jgi:hypothetical protein